MKKTLMLLSLALILVCAPSVFADHIPPMGSATSASTNAQAAHEERSSETAHAAVSTAVQVILNLIALGVGR